MLLIEHVEITNPKVTTSIDFQYVLNYLCQNFIPRKSIRMALKNLSSYLLRFSNSYYYFFAFFIRLMTLKFNGDWKLFRSCWLNPR
jgi:hypothetical protein